MNMILVTFVMMKGPISSDVVCYMEETINFTCNRQFVLTYVHIIIAFVALTIMLYLQSNVVTHRHVLYFKIIVVISLCCLIVLYGVMLPIISNNTQRATIAGMPRETERKMVITVDAFAFISLFASLVEFVYSEIREHTISQQTEDSTARTNIMIEENKEPGVMIVITEK